MKKTPPSLVELEPSEFSKEFAKRLNAKYVQASPQSSPGGGHDRKPDPVHAMARAAFHKEPGDCTCGKPELASLTEGHAASCSRWKAWFKSWNEAVRLVGANEKT